MLLARSVLRRRLDYPGLVVVALGWMVTLSWGAARPAFMAGVLAVYVLARTWEGFAWPGENPIPLASAPILRAAAVVAAAVVVATFWDARHAQGYLPPRATSALTMRMGGVAYDLKGIRTDPATGGYLAQVRDCAKSHPAPWTTVFPEDTISPTAFDFHSPFPMDWLWPGEYGDATGKSRKRIVQAAQDLGRRGQYLVMFQTMTIGELFAVPSPPLRTAAPGEPPRPFPFDPPLTGQIWDALHGQRIACGSLVGVYEPRRL